MNINPEINAWLILGVTTVLGIIGFVIRKLFFKQKNSGAEQSQKAGDGAEMYQAGGNMHVDKSVKKD